MTTTLPMPPLAGTRQRARALLDGLPDNLLGAAVVIDCRGLVAATESFADELVHEILVVRKGGALRFANVSDMEFAKWIDDRAIVHGVADKVVVDRG